MWMSYMVYLQTRLNIKGNSSGEMSQESRQKKKPSSSWGSNFQTPDGTTFICPNKYNHHGLMQPSDPQETDMLPPKDAGSFVGKLANQTSAGQQRSQLDNMDNNKQSKG